MQLQSSLILPSFLDNGDTTQIISGLQGVVTLQDSNSVIITLLHS